MPTVLGELWCGHITSVSLGWAGVSYFGIVSGGVPCATTDEESGSSLKLELRVTTRTDFKKLFLLNRPLHKILFFCKLNRNLILDLPMHVILI